MNACCKRVIAGTAFLVLLAGRLMDAQSPTATIAGTVKDQTGARLAGATVTIGNVDTGDTRRRTTAVNGEFIFAVLPIGTYDVTVEAEGFKKLTREPIVLTMSRTAVVDARLSLADIPKSVTVTPDAPLVNKTNSEISVIFEGLRVSGLPNSGLGGLGGGFRDPWSHALSVAGVSQINSGNFGGPQGTDYAVNGNNLRGNSWGIDGQKVTDLASGGRGMTWNNPDAVEQFQMLTNQFAPEHGGAAGSLVSLVTKAGTNDWRGSLFWFYNSNRLNSLSNLDKAGGLSKAPLRIEHQMGGTLGGPLVRNRTFVFGSLQRWTDRNRSSGLTIGSAPTEAGRALLQANGGTRATVRALLENLPAAQSAPTGIVPYCYNAAPWTGPGAPPAASPDPNNPGQFMCGFAGWSAIAVPVGTLNNSNLIRYNDWQWSARVDHHFNSNHMATARYMMNNDLQTGAGQATPPGLGNATPSRSQAATVGLTSTLSPYVVNELRINWSRFAFYTGPQNAATLGVPSIEVANLGLNGFSSVLARTAIGYPANLPEGRRSNIYQLTNNMTWHHGRHTVKWGIDIQKQEMASESNNNVRGQLRYSTLTNLVADFADGRASLNRPLPGGQYVLHFNWTDLAFFIQDDWRVTPHLTLNLGVRYELPGNAIASLYAVSDRIVAANGNDPLFRYMPRPPRDTNNVMPRVGFNWNLADTGVPFMKNFVMRGGFARAYNFAFLISMVQSAAGFPFQGAFNITGAPGTMDALAALSSQTPTLTAASLPNQSQTLFSPDFRSPVSDQFSLEFQREIGENNAFRFGYVGTRGSDLFQSHEGNPTTRCGLADCPRVDPSRGVIRLRANTGRSIYHSLQLSFDHRYSRGISGGAHLTISRFKDNGSDIVNPSTSEMATPQDPLNPNAGEWARSTYDRPLRLTGNAVYELPFLKTRRGALGRMASGWQVGVLATIQSGSPFTVLNGSDPGNILRGSLIGSAVRPNFAPDVNVGELQNMTVREIRQRVLEAGSPAVFFRSSPSNGGPTVTAPAGNVPRNFLRSDGLVSIDLNIVKNIRVGGEHRLLQIRADIFNLPNTRNFGIPNGFANATAFDFLNEAATDGGNRRIFLSMRYAF